MINAYWMLSPNFGDALTPYLIEKMSDQKVVYTPTDVDIEHHIVTGSILNHGNENSIIWGAGIANEYDEIPECKKIAAVRGPLTLEKVIETYQECDTYGDPALLMPKFYNPYQAKEYEVGIIPHYVDYAKVLEAKHPYAHVINILDPIEKVIDELLKCERILSSSLHGLIISDAYNIPNLWVRFGDRIFGDGFKFRDYFASTERPEYPAHDLTNLKDVKYVRKKIKPFDIQIDTEKLLRSCPFV